MTEPSAMPTGRQLDIEVATKIMGLKVMALDWPCGYDPDSGLYSAAMQRESPSGWFNEVGPVFEISEDWATPVPHYSSDIADAWQVVEHLTAQGYLIAMFQRAPDYFWVTFERECIQRGEGTGNTAMEALCKAALAVTE